MKTSPQKKAKKISKQKTIPSLPSPQKELENTIETITGYLNPEAILPSNAPFKGIKKILLRLLRVYTTIQVEFNSGVLHTLNLFKAIVNQQQKEIITHEKRITDLSQEWNGHQKSIEKKHIEDIDAFLQEKFIALQKSLKHTNPSGYSSLYFPQFEDEFYLFQQEKFRGPYEMIRERQLKYLPYIKSVKKLAQKSPFIDIGFGRGEFLEILKEQKLEHIIGVDINEKYCKQGAKNGYKTVCSDGITYLQKYDGTLSGISAFHVVEHLTFAQLFDLVYLAHMKLEEGGLLLFETPNPENVLVSSTTFYIDHTHIMKLPPAFLTSLLEFFKFKKIEILYNIFIKENPENDVEKHLFGPMDYAIVAYK